MREKIMFKYIFIILSILFNITVQATPIMTFKSDSNYADTKENIESAIINQGLKISGMLHISEMLQRTGKDLGFNKNIYQKAESFEFCSALVSHKMTQLSPLNLAVCPFTISIYIKDDEPKQVYLAFKKINLAGKNKEEVVKVTKIVENLLQTIVNEALDGF
jgi:uncharacterized protein (DUF302 family)